MMPRQRTRLHETRSIIVAALTSLSIVALFAAKPAVASEFVKTERTQFVLDGKPFYVTGVNNHYLPWGSDAEVTRVLDDAVAMGANVVRTFLDGVIGSPDGAIAPTIWKFRNDEANSSALNIHGHYFLYWDPSAHGMEINASSMRKIDLLIAEAAKRRLRLILTFLDFWSFTGGAYQMSSWYDLPTHQGAPWDTTNPAFFTDARVLADYQRWVKFVVERINPLTKIAYRDDPTIFAWELMNEAQAPTALHRQWETQMAAYVKSLDRNHIVGAGDDYPIFDAPGIDFVTWHGYPKYLAITPAQFNNEITSKCRMAPRYQKPVVLEEFGYARSNADQAQAYQMWLNTMAADSDCAGWLVWRLVSPQDDGQYPKDEVNQFDVHHDDGETWQVLSNAAHLGRPGAGAGSLLTGSTPSWSVYDWAKAFHQGR
jgi:mannan endo-1,4-beta-mannosidase